MLRKILGLSLFKRTLKSTFYGHFVAGETLDEVRPFFNKFYDRKGGKVLRSLGRFQNSINLALNLFWITALSRTSAMRRRRKKPWKASKRSHECRRFSSHFDIWYFLLNISFKALDVLAAEQPSKNPLIQPEKTLQQYSVHKEFGDRREHVVSARTYFYSGVSF
jgi:hypothetical protein